MNSAWRTSKTLAALAALAVSGLAQNNGLVQRDISVKRLGTAAELKMPVNVPRGYAVVIGISKYKNVAADQALPFAEKDAQNVYSALISKEAGQIEYENVRRLLGPDATLANIKDALENWLPSKAKPGDRVIVYFVGHGVVDQNGKGYLAPYDIDVNHIAETGYSMEQIGKVLSSDVKAGWKLLLLDACHSGQINVTSTSARVNESLRGLPQGFLTLTSSRASESSYEDPALAGGNGVFSYFLVQGWKGDADVDPADGTVTADELVAYVKREVNSYVKRQGGKQTPLEFGDFPDDLVLGYSPARRGTLVAKVNEPVNGNVVIEANLENTEVYVDDQRLGIASPTAPLRIPGLSPGNHTVKGVRMGYDPVSIEVNVIPGGTQTVSLRLLIQRTPKADAKKAFDDAEEIWKRSRANPSDLSKAADLYAKAVKEDPKYSPAVLGLCRVQEAQGKADDALKTCKKATQLDPDFVEARATYGVVLMETGDYAEAVRQLQTASTQDPKSSFNQSLFAEALFLADRPKEAEAAADRAIQLDNSLSQGYLLRAEARRVQMRYDEAAADYQKSLQLQDFNSGFLRQIAFYSIGTGVKKNRSGRQTIYRSQAASAYFGLCGCELGKEDFREALHYCNQVIRLDQNDVDSRLLMAEAYAGLFSQDNRRDYLLKTKDEIDQALRLNPDQEKAPTLRAKLKEINELLTNVP